MKKSLFIPLILFFTINIFGQCDSLDYSRLINAVKYSGVTQYVKFAFEKTSEDSTTLVFTRCPWQGEPKCVPYHEYLLVSKVNFNYRRFHCYDHATYQRLSKELLANAEEKEIDGKKFKVVEKKIILNFTETTLEANECKLTHMYFIEFLIE